ncbi:MAG: sodium-translocating pyrophosphatase [bacterium]
MGEWTLFERVAVWSVLGCGLIGIVYGIYLIRQIIRHKTGTEKMQEISGAIREGANAYLNRQFKTIIFVMILLAIFLFITGEDINMKIGRSLSFLVGAFFSAFVGFIGMTMAVRGNVRTAEAARTSFPKALEIAFRTGAITGMFTIGLGLLGCTTIFIIYGEKAYEVLIGFGFGGSLLALFMRVGGGIYTKAADIGADLVGKVEAGIPEDDPRNPATIADNVGDNVGDCAGMAADLFESYEVTLVASMILGWYIFGRIGVIFPLIVRGVGVITSIVGTYIVKARKKDKSAMAPINRSFFVSALLSGIGLYFFAHYYVKDIRVFWATIIGLGLAICISLLTEYFTSMNKKPVREVAEASLTGHATNLLAGFSVGMESSVWAIMVISISIYLSFIIAKGNASLAMYLISLCGMGMLTTTGLIVSMDSYGPVVDNANGIGQMAELEPEARTIMHRLDAVGNTTKAITKGFAIASAVVAATSLFGSYFEVTGLSHIDVAKPIIFIGLLIGGAIPFLFTSIAIRAVTRAAGSVIKEVRRQFREIKGLLEGRTRPEYVRCVDICTKSALNELVGLGIIAIFTPILIGFFLKIESLGGFLAGIILSGQILAVFLANSGCAWDNAKKLIEDGELGGKGSEAHKVSVVGDTVGDPFKDTAGPALNPLIKVMNLVALLTAPMIMRYSTNVPITVIVIITSLVLLWFAIWRTKKKFIRID